MTRERKAGEMSGLVKRKRWLAVVAAMTVALCLAVCLPGCGKGEPKPEELWEKSQEAQEKITSLHMEIAISYKNTEFGSGQIQTTTIDISGDNVHTQSAIFGQSFSEVIVTGGKQYGRFLGEKEWTEQPVSVTAKSVSQQVEGFSALPDIASSKENKGLERVGGKDAYHLTFSLTPEEVSELFKNVPVAQLSASKGGTVDVWVEKDTYYRVRYEALVQNVLITDKIGYGDVHITAALTNINEPIKINPPV